MGSQCNVSEYCIKLGLHAHHPRNCLFYLRDKLPIQLQILLKDHGVSYEQESLLFHPNPNPNTNPNPNPNENKAKTTKETTPKKTTSPMRCPMPIQKETPGGLVDTRCNNDVPDHHAGLCRNHYVEYLAALVAKADIDPLSIFDLTDCVQELRRHGHPLPERGPWDTDEIYKNMCAEVRQFLLYLFFYLFFLVFFFFLINETSFFFWFPFPGNSAENPFECSLEVRNFLLFPVIVFSFQQSE